MVVFPPAHRVSLSYADATKKDRPKAAPSGAWPISPGIHTSIIAHYCVHFYPLFHFPAKSWRCTNCTNCTILRPLTPITPNIEIYIPYPIYIIFLLLPFHSSNGVIGAVGAVYIEVYEALRISGFFSCTNYLKNCTNCTNFNLLTWDRGRARSPQLHQLDQQNGRAAP